MSSSCYSSCCIDPPLLLLLLAADGANQAPSAPKCMQQAVQHAPPKVQQLARPRPSASVQEGGGQTQTQCTWCWWGQQARLGRQCKCARGEEDPDGENEALSLPAQFYPLQALFALKLEVDEQWECSSLLQFELQMGEDPMSWGTSCCGGTQFMRPSCSPQNRTIYPMGRYRLST